MGRIAYKCKGGGPGTNAEQWEPHQGMKKVMGHLQEGVSGIFLHIVHDERKTHKCMIAKKEMVKRV